MIKNIILALIVIFALAFWSQHVSSSEKTDIHSSQAPVVVELFTSQSCSSCPPADKVLTALARHDNVIALSCNVTYWNHLSWKDTLSRQFCTDRQRGYAAAMNSRRVYTPQMVVNGSIEFVGSNRGKAQSAINKAAGKIKAIEISKSGNVMQVSLPEIEKGTYTLLVMGIGESLTQDVPSGENRGKSLHYTNPVSTLDNLRDWDGSAQTREYEIADGLRGISVIAQPDRYGPIVAAGKTDF